MERVRINCHTGDLYTETFEYQDAQLSVAELTACKLAELEATLKEHMDTITKSRRYSGIASLVSYEGDEDPTFNKEGTAGRLWRSACWVKYRQIEEAVLQDKQALPTKQELIGMLPVFNWGE